MIGQGEYYPIAQGEKVPDGVLSEWRAVWTGEFRPPNKGEYYLSSAITQKREGYYLPAVIVEAYLAFHDFRMQYHIAELVHGKTVWVPDKTEGERSETND